MLHDLLLILLLSVDFLELAYTSDVGFRCVRAQRRRFDSSILAALCSRVVWKSSMNSASYCASGTIFIWVKVSMYAFSHARLICIVDSPLAPIEYFVPNVSTNALAPGRVVLYGAL